MKIEFIFAEEITDCESISELNCEDSEIPEGKLVSSKELCEYCAIAEKILTEAENYFPTFAKDTGTTVSVYFMGNENIREINAEQRDIDRATDVLSFPFLELHEGDGEISEYDLNPENGAIMLGDILVSVEKMKEQAKEYGHSDSRELAFLLCHGYLHLMGFDHIEKEDEIKMMTVSEEILSNAGFIRE
jgi:probable rRNA maturation factor